jgi:hypothetical protein
MKSPRLRVVAFPWFSRLRCLALQGKVTAVANPHDHPTALKDLQDSIYREKVLRARAMTPEERLDSVFEMSDFQLDMMHAGAMNRIGTSDPVLGWQEVKRWLQRLDHARDFRFYSPMNKPAA